MAIRNNSPREVFDDSDPLGVEPVHTSVHFRLPGLYDAGGGNFVLEGVMVREIDWEMVAKGLGRKHLPDSLVSEIDRVCFQHGVAEVIAERMTRVED